MNIGFVTYWFPRGQAYINRFVREIFDEVGHETFVLARANISPMKDISPINSDWSRKNLTIGTRTHNIPLEFYQSWIKENKLNVVFFFQNYQFEEIEAIRNMGITTIGTFMWENFAQNHVNDAKKAYSKIYSLHKGEVLRNKLMGLDSTSVRWGIHPSIINNEVFESRKTVFHFPCGYDKARKNSLRLLKTFVRTTNPEIELLVTQIAGQKYQYSDSRINFHKSKTPLIKDFLHVSSQCHAYIIPSRWEGLCLSLYEAIGMGKPIIATNMSPLREHIEHEKTGYLVKSVISGKTPSGLPMYEINMDDLSKGIELLANQDVIHEMRKNVLKKQKSYSWENTKTDFLELVNL